MTRIQSYLSYALFVAVSCGVWWQPLARTFSLALHNDEYTHLLLILPVSATLILLEWRSQKPAVQANFRLGSVLLIMVVLLTGFANWRSAGLELTMFNFQSACLHCSCGGSQASWFVSAREPLAHFFFLSCFSFGWFRFHLSR